MSSITSVSVYKHFFFPDSGSQSSGKYLSLVSANEWLEIPSSKGTEGTESCFLEEPQRSRGANVISTEVAPFFLVLPFNGKNNCFLLLCLCILEALQNVFLTSWITCGRVICMT